MKQCILPAVVCSAVVVALVNPLRGDVMNCASGNLSTVDHTTCDIGNLQFTFSGLMGFNAGIPWTDSDFMFTVLSNGFELSGPAAQTLSGNPLVPVNDFAQLQFSVTDLTDTITGLDVSGGNLSASGSDSYAEYLLYLSGAGSGQFEQATSFFVSNFASGLDSHNASGASIGSGLGYAEPFGLFVIEGGTASIDSTATDFTFTTGPFVPAVPEPHLLTLLGVGILGLLTAARRNERSSR